MRPKLSSNYGSTVLPRAGLTLGETGTLPTATVKYLGQIRLSDGRAYICADIGGSTYRWISLTQYEYLTGTTTWDPPSVANGNFERSTVTVTGAGVGDPCQCGMTTITGDWMAGCVVSAANTCNCTFRNQTGGAVDPASGTLRCTVFNHF